MPNVVTKCTVCGALLDEEDLFCPNCGTEAPTTANENRQFAANKDAGTRDGRPGAEAQPASHISTFNFTCRGCGASMSYDASAQALRCPFCGSTELDKKPDAKEIAPDAVVPFVVTRDQAVETMRNWLGHGFWRPGDLAESAAVVAMTPIYVPYWVFEADTYTYWTADSSQTPPGARADWFPVCGQHEGSYAGLLVGASCALTAAETTALCPFDLTKAEPPERVDLQNITLERFTVPRKYARPMASQGLEDLERQACEQYVAGKCRNLNVNVRITNLASRPMLVPVWIMAYRYRDKVFRFLANGQSGRAAGQAPISYRKIGVAVAIAAVIIVLLLLLFASMARGRQRQFHFSDSRRLGNCVIAQEECSTKSGVCFVPPARC